MKKACLVFNGHIVIPVAEVTVEQVKALTEEFGNPPVGKFLEVK